jgi:hypothetical protein
LEGLTSGQRALFHRSRTFENLLFLVCFDLSAFELPTYSREAHWFLVYALLKKPEQPKDHLAQNVAVVSKLKPLEHVALVFPASEALLFLKEAGIASP